MNKMLAAYLAGVITTPVAVVIFRKPLAHLMLHKVIADEQFTEPLYRLMTARNDLIDRKEQKES